MFHPVRDGNRGGHGLFSWESVRTDEKHRENYLGHSVKAAVGRWQKDKDLGWYAKDTTRTVIDIDRTELLEMKRMEQDAMEAALGGKVRRNVDPNITTKDLKQVIPSGIGNVDGDDEKGLGFGRSSVFGGSVVPQVHGKGTVTNNAPQALPVTEPPSQPIDDKELKKDKKKHSKKHKHSSHDRDDERHGGSDRRDRTSLKRKHDLDDNDYKRRDDTYRRREDGSSSRRRDNEYRSKDDGYRQRHNDSKKRDDDYSSRNDHRKRR